MIWIFFILYFVRFVSSNDISVDGVSFFPFFIFISIYFSTSWKIEIAGKNFKSTYISTSTFRHFNWWKCYNFYWKIYNFFATAASAFALRCICYLWLVEKMLNWRDLGRAAPDEYEKAHSFLGYQFAFHTHTLNRRGAHVIKILFTCSTVNTGSCDSAYGTLYYSWHTSPLSHTLSLSPALSLLLSLSCSLSCCLISSHTPQSAVRHEHGPSQRQKCFSQIWKVPGQYQFGVERLLPEPCAFLFSFYFCFIHSLLLLPTTSNSHSIAYSVVSFLFFNHMQGEIGCCSACTWR